MSTGNGSRDDADADGVDYIEATHIGVLVGLRAKSCPSCADKHPVLLLETLLSDGEPANFILEIPHENNRHFGGLPELIVALQDLAKAIQNERDGDSSTKRDLN